MSRVGRLAALLGAIVFPSVVQASCTQGNATGRWLAAAGVFSVNSDWVTCRLLVSSTGQIANTQCRNENAQFEPLTQGTLRLAHGASCTFRAQFRVGGSLQVADLAMARDKNTMHGIGVNATNGFVLDLVKVDAFPRSRIGEVPLGQSLPRLP